MEDRVQYVAVAFGAVALWFAEQLSATGPSTSDVLWAAPLTVLAAGGSVVVARTRPVEALALFVMGYAGQVAVTGWVDSVVTLVLWCGLLALAARRTELPAAIVALVVGSVPVVVFVLGRDDPDAGNIGPSTMALWLIPWLAGRMLRARYVRHQQEIALLRIESERKDAEERAARAEDRAAIARDVHDLLGHTVTSIVVQARSARALIDSDPPNARRALDAVEVAGQAAVAELRSLVAGLAAPQRDATEQRCLADIAGLVERAPMEVRHQVDPEANRLPLPVQAAAYRVVQEALTNAIRHSQAPTADLSVRLDEEDGVLCIEVSDPGPPATQPLPGAGTGLAGVRSRAEALGGSLEAGPVDSGFVVRAVLPVGMPR
ncbi:MAG TPA: histidine kinase [Nocardioidaceae bacterium]|nr:histidine kinase [Nocardioidaceae bacterium]